MLDKSISKMAQKQGSHKTLKTKGNQEPWEVRCFHHQSFCCQHLQMRDEIQGPSKAGNLIELINKARTFKISECKINPTRQNNTITEVVSLKKKSLSRIQNHQFIFTGVCGPNPHYHCGPRTLKWKILSGYK